MAGLSGHASGSAVVAVTTALTALAAVVVFTRLFTRIWIVREPGLDDGFISLALLFSIATTITMCLQVKWGMGQHVYVLQPEQIVQMSRAFYVSVWVYNLSMSCTKFSILLQYLRIFPQRGFRILCYILIAIIAIYACWTFFSAIFACWPIAYFWNPEAYPEGHCLNRYAVWFANAGMNIATDFFIGLLPLPMLRGLQLPRRQRMALMIVFGLGGFTCVVSILRLRSLQVISKAKDITWQNPMAAIWSSVEINTGMLCSCLPTLRGLMSHIFPSVLSTNRSSTRPTDPSTEQSASKHSTHSRHQSFGHQARKSLEALGRSLSGMSDIGLKNTRSSHTDGSSEEIDFQELDNRSNVDDGQIQVVTVVEQDVGRVSEDSSY